MQLLSNLPLLPEGWKCKRHGDTHVNPSDCNKYYVCVKEKKIWKYEDHSCATDYSFHEIENICVPGKCPQDPPEIPKDWMCGHDGDQRVHPDDCGQYYTCMWVNVRGDEYYTYSITSCPGNQNFDEISSMCVDGRCPQIGPPLPPSVTCLHDGELVVDPRDCSMFLKCIAFTDSGMTEWTYISQQCPKGETFDDSKKGCVNGR